MSLQILKYDPNDYKLEEILSLPHGVKINETATIQKIISLYLTWIARTRLELFIDKEKSSGRLGEISIDLEERQPSQLFIHTPNIIDNTNPEYVFARLQIFEKCYDFELKVLEVFQENSGSTYITDIPTSLSSVKERKTPRIKMEATTSHYLILDTDKFRISTIGPQSIIADGLIPEGLHSFTLNDHQFIGMSQKIAGQKTLVVASQEDDSASSGYFLAYASIAFPQLSPIARISNEARFNLYKDAGYFSVFNDEDLAITKEKLFQSWEITKKFQGKDLIDFAALDGNKLCGASGLARAFTETNNNISSETWVFHQLCALKDEENLETTKQLYRWRAEYISAKKESIKTRFWFRSSSRWLERIYVKFSIAKNRDVLKPVNLLSCNFSSSKTISNEWTLDKSSTIQRLVYDKDGIIGGASPEYLNASRLLNMVLTEDPDKTHLLESIASQSNESYMVICQPYDATTEGERLLPSDRMAKLEQHDMIDFISCLEHSIAVTIQKRKGEREQK